MKSAVVLLFTMSVFAQDNVDVLARILADKGTITPAELARVEAAAPSDRVGALAILLRQKGLITETEAASISPQSAGATAQQTTAAGQRPPVEPPAAPVTAQSRFPVSVYGTILLNAVYNTATTNIVDIPLFTATQGANTGKTYAMTARQSRLGLRYDGRGEVAGADLSGDVEVDFLGGKAPFTNGANMDIIRLRLAYGRMDWHNFALEAGQDWSIFAPLNPTSYAEFAIPSLSAAGNPWIRMPQLRAEIHGSVADNVSLLAQVAAVDPNMGDYNTAVFSAARTPGAGERGGAPGAEARFAITGKHDDRDFTIGFSGHYAHGDNAGTVGSITQQLALNSWGAAVDYVLPFSSKFNLSGEVYTGRALAIFSVTSGEGIAPVGTVGDRGVRSSGGWAQAQFNFTPKWQVNLDYGIDDPATHDLAVGLRTRNQNYMGNLIYKYTTHALIAWEYRRILTDFHDQPASNVRGSTANLALGYVF